jgi:hypothetical protein
MSPFDLSMIQQTLTQNRANGVSPFSASSQNARRQMMGTLGAMNDYRNPAVWAQVQQATAHMDPASKYLYAMAHRIPPQAMGMYPQTINYLEQSLMGFHMDKNTGQIMQDNGYGSTPVPPGQLQSAVQNRNGADITQVGGMALTGNTGNNYGAGSQQWRADQANAINYDYNGVGNPNYAMDAAHNTWGRYGAGLGGGNNLPPNDPRRNPPGAGVDPNSNIGGGTGNPNNAAGGLYGAAGNAIRQQMMDSTQFNPNGSNSYAIQNMNLSGQGGLGSNMGGMAGSNGLFGGAVQTAQGNGSTSGAAMPSTPNYTTATNQNQTASMPTATGALGTQTPGTGVQTTQTTSGGTPSYFGGAVSTPRLGAMQQKYGTR